MEKRGLSPVIATTLLISIALILALIIFLWARSFIPEKLLKEDSPIEDFCDAVSFDAEIIEGSIDVVNRGNVPLYGIGLKSKGAFSTKDCGITTFGSTASLLSGETSTGNQINCDIDPSRTYYSYPVLLGQTSNVKKAYPCTDDKYSIEVQIVNE